MSALLFFFFNDTATTEIYTLSLHDALPISVLDWFNPQAAAAARWTQTVLTPGSRRYLASLPKYGRIGRHRLDRKSTRLNSSHSQISYAVFCLKKKKITT